MPKAPPFSSPPVAICEELVGRVLNKGPQPRIRLPPFGLHIKYMFDQNALAMGRFASEAFSRCFLSWLPEAMKRIWATPRGFARPCCQLPFVAACGAVFLEGTLEGNHREATHLFRFPKKAHPPSSLLALFRQVLHKSELQKAGGGGGWGSLGTSSGMGFVPDCQAPQEK